MITAIEISYTKQNLEDIHGPQKRTHGKSQNLKFLYFLIFIPKPLHPHTCIGSIALILCRKEWNMKNTNPNINHNFLAVTFDYWVIYKLHDVQIQPLDMRIPGQIEWGLECFTRKVTVHEHCLKTKGQDVWYKN